MHRMAWDLLLAHPTIRARRAARYMNQIDKLELLANVSALRREAKALLADSTGAEHAARLRRILMILGYMREHLEMVALPARSPAANADAPDKTASRAADEPRPVSERP